MQMKTPLGFCARLDAEVQLTAGNCPSEVLVFAESCSEVGYCSRRFALLRNDLQHTRADFKIFTEVNTPHFFPLKIGEGTGTNSLDCLHLCSWLVAKAASQSKSLRLW